MNELSEYKGKAIISLFDKPDTPPQRRFTFGVSKAKLILDNLDVIRKFVSDNATVEETVKFNF